MKYKEKMKLFLLLLFCSDLFAVKHSLKFFITGSSGIPSIPEYVAGAVVDGILAAYCDSNKKTVEPKLDWMRKVFDNKFDMVKLYTERCSVHFPNFFRDCILSLKQQFNQSEGVHVFQWIHGCELEENTGEVIGFSRYGYDGENFLELDLKTQTWTALKPEANITKQRWDTDRTKIKYDNNFLTQICPELLKIGMDYGKSFLQRTVLPSVSLLQKTSSSPVSCHATGFFPDRAMMLWRKDGEEIHEGVEHRETLPNSDGTFQMSIDLNVSSVTPEDWRRCECVFQLSDIKGNIVTKLDKTMIRTNWGKTEVRNGEETIPIIVVVIVLVVLILVAAIGFAVYKKKKETRSASSSGNMSDLSERLNPETLHRQTQNPANIIHTSS